MRAVISQHKNALLESAALTGAYGLVLVMGVKFVLLIV
jgi:hypothetical protein